MPKEKYIIKKAQANDVDGVVKLYDTVNDYYSAPGWGKGVYPTLTSVRYTVDKDNLYILVSDGEVLGACTLDHAKKCNATTIRLDTHITNIPARALYEKCGFHEITQWTGTILGIQQTFSVFEYLL